MNIWAHSIFNIGKLCSRKIPTPMLGTFLAQADTDIENCIWYFCICPTEDFSCFQFHWILSFINLENIDNILQFFFISH